LLLSSQSSVVIGIPGSPVRHRSYRTDGLRNVEVLAITDVIKQMKANSTKPSAQAEQIGGMDFVTFAPVLEPLVRKLEKRKAERMLSSKVRKWLPKVVKGLLVKGWSEDEKDNWGLRSAADRRLAELIQSLS
jgi:hypothetical protein